MAAIRCAQVGCSRGLTPLPARDWDRRTLSPVVWQRWAWCRSRKRATSLIPGRPLNGTCSWSRDINPELAGFVKREPDWLGPERFGHRLALDGAEWKSQMIKGVGPVTGSRDYTEAKCHCGQLF